MTCPKCKQKCVYVKFNTFEYWYCKECKEEVKEEQNEETNKHTWPEDWWWG